MQFLFEWEDGHYSAEIGAEGEAEDMQEVVGDIQRA